MFFCALDETYWSRGGLGQKSYKKFYKHFQLVFGKILFYKHFYQKFYKKIWIFTKIQKYKIYKNNDNVNVNDNVI